MGEPSFFSVVLSVIKNQYVIGTGIFAIFVIKFAGYVVHYKKKPPVPKKAKPKPVAPPPPPKNEDGEGEGDGE